MLEVTMQIRLYLPCYRHMDKLIQSLCVIARVLRCCAAE